MAPDLLAWHLTWHEGLLNEARGVDAEVIDAYLRTAGFDDVGGDWPLVLATLTQHEDGGGLTAKMGVTGETASQISDTLVERGYLKRRSAPDGRQITLLTTRGWALLRGIWRYVVRPARWAGFPFRPGDIVIATPPKSGTTWIQMICALLVLQTPDLPAPLPELSPWLDAQEKPRDEAYGQLASQQHRRFIKTHTPLSEMALSPLATYIVIARHPLDAGVSLHHHISIADAASQRNGQPEPDGSRMSEHEWLLRWIDEQEYADGLPQFLGQLSDAWARRSEPNIVLVHYEDLSADLEGEMRRLAERLGITVPGAAWPSLVNAATFGQMRAAASQLAPIPPGEDGGRAAFFRQGTSGSGRELLTHAELASYQARAAELAPPDLLAWLHRATIPQ